MNTPLVAIICLLIPAALAAQKNPSGAEVPAWVVETQKEKPYVLDFAYANTSKPLPGKEGAATGASIFLVTDAFLANAKRFRIGVLPNETGMVEREDGSRIVFRIQKREKGFMLQIFAHIAEDGGSRMINTIVLLPDGEWSVVGGLRPQESDRETKGFYVAIRIDRRG